MTNNSHDTILTLKEVSEFLKVPHSQAYCLVRSGSIGAFKVGKHWRIPSKELNDWVEKQKKLFTY